MKFLGVAGFVVVEAYNPVSELCRLAGGGGLSGKIPNGLCKENFLPFSAGSAV